MGDTVGSRADTQRKQPLISPPEWLIRGLRPQRAPIPRAAVVRASIALAAPLAVGLAAGQPGYGALVAMGALSGVIGDTADAYRMRIFNIAVPQCFGAVGVMIGTLVYGDGWIAVAVLTLVALVSGMISTIGAVASVSGLLLLLNSVVGAGLPMPGPWWKAPLLLSLGGLFVLVLALVGWPLRARTPERTAVAATYRAAAELLAAAGTTAYGDRRQAVTGSLNASYDLILARRAHYHGRSTSMVRLLAQLNVLVPLIEAAAAAHLHGRASRRPEIAAAVRDLADVVATGRSDAVPDLVLPEPEGPADRAMNAALRHAAAVVHHADSDHPDHYGADDRLGRPAELGVRARRAAATVLLSPTSWRYGLRLALCIGLAQVLVSVVSVPRSYWVALTVTFVLKPDFGSVFSRAVLRALGTAVGVLTAALVLGVVPRGWWDVPVMVVLAALIPAVSANGYAFQTAAITPVILLISDQLNHLGFHLVLPRLLDSLIGCGITLIAGYLLWPESWHTRIGDRLAVAVEESARYVECAFGGGIGSGRTDSGADTRTDGVTGARTDGGTAAPGDHGDRARLRRRLYRDLSVVRTEFQRALTEPPPTGKRAAAWWPLVVAAERIVDATTAARVRVDHGARPPAPEEVGEVTKQLRELAQGLRSSATLVEVPTRIEGDDEGVLAPLRQEVVAAREIASPQR
ncbi:FUSC family protein [Streptomyces sp. NPDC088348]|uniref:FUSC family protein n=1 Tax=Streptomyces sp. NPDC088348 TaxID=3365853 RepID=UPI003822EAA2